MPKPADLVIRNGTVVTPDGVVTGDVTVHDGTIQGVGQSDSDSAEVIDASGLWVMPGGVDVHAHIEQMSGMGQWNADTFETATQSAAMGGTTTVVSFAAQATGERLTRTVADYAARARRGAMIDYAFHITLTDTGVDALSADLAALIAAGHRSIKVFTTYNIQLDDAQILDVLAQARQHGALVCVHAENDAIIARTRASLIAKGQTRPTDHALSRPRMAEIEAIERMCRFAEYLDQPVMIFHVSTAEGADAIRQAQARGAPIWAETCPHYLFMTDAVLDQPGIQGAKFMCSPPQRTKDDQDALWAALADGTLSLVSSDHAPYRFDESGKLSAGSNPGFHQIANGLPGLETRLPLLFDAMVTQGRGGPDAFAALTATRPARVHGLPDKGAIAKGLDADIVLWDPARQVTYGSDDLHDNVGYNPWAGYSVTGWPVHVLLRGETIMRDGQFLARPGQGRWIERPTVGVAPRNQAGAGA